MLKLTLGTTALLGAVAASAATLFPELPLRILYFTKPEFWQCAPLVPWFAWCMLLFTLANALVTNLLARGRFAIAGVLILLAAAYGVTLWLLRDRLLAMEMFAALQARGADHHGLQPRVAALGDVAYLGPWKKFPSGGGCRSRVTSGAGDAAGCVDCALRDR